jgi:hypothetical protein
MAFVVQDPDSPKSDANGYITAQEFKDYHAERGNAYTANDTEIQQAIVRATDFVDSRWTFAGYRQDADQSTECPRSGVYDPTTSYLLDGYPDELKEACAEYAMASINGEALYPSSNVDATGRAVKKAMKKADVVEKETEYFSGSSGSAWKTFPVADGKMVKTRLLQSRRRTLGRA